MRRRAPFVVGVLLGLAIAAFLLRRPRPFVERVVTRPLAAASEAADWDARGARRGTPFERFPDPPGDGPVVTARYWVSLPAYDMEVRRRGGRLTLGIRG